MAQMAQIVPKIRLGLSQTQLKSQSSSTFPQTHLGLSQTHLKSSQKIPKSHKKIQMTSKSTPNFPKSSKDTSNPKTSFSIHPRNPRKFPKTPGTPVQVSRITRVSSSSPSGGSSSGGGGDLDLWDGGKIPNSGGEIPNPGGRNFQGIPKSLGIVFGAPEPPENPKIHGNFGAPKLPGSPIFGIPIFGGPKPPGNPKILGNSPILGVSGAIPAPGSDPGSPTLWDPAFWRFQIPKKSRNPRGFPHSGSSAEPLGRSRPSIPNF